MHSPSRITIAHGDGIGPEIMDAVLYILDKAGANLEYDTIQIGEKVYASGSKTGISDESWAIIQKNGNFLKAPITTPQGGGFKSMNVTIRKTLGLFANVRPVQAYTPFVRSNFSKMDMVIIRENEEDLYAGIEHRQTQEVMQVLKLISRPGCERIIRYAFEYARAFGRKKVTCMTKDNIMKQADGLFHKVFNEIALEYPEIKADHLIIDIGSAIVANRPSTLDVVVTLNLYGDIISDIAAEVAGSVGLGGSSNVGKKVSMYEAIHGSAPDIAGKDLANPSGLLNAAIMMLGEMGKTEVADTIKNAWLCTLEDGIHTGDIFKIGQSQERVGTKAFAEAIVSRLGKKPETLEPAHTAGRKSIQIKEGSYPHEEKKLEGIDIFLDWDKDERNPDVLGHALQKLTSEDFKLQMISNRGLKVFPNGFEETYCTDHWRCRFLRTKESIGSLDLLALQKRVVEAGFDIIKTENLFSFDGLKGYSLGQGE